MRQTDVAIIGAGPAGLAAAVQAASSGANVLLLERDQWLGGQLVKQTHRFFGSQNEFAGIRGIDIATLYAEKVQQHKNIEVLLGAPAVGYYKDDGVLAASYNGRLEKIKAKSIIVATGAMEKMIPFANNDLPGVYGAGAVQTLMNVYGVYPGQRVLMVGAGNIGLIVSYQLIQAGVDVVSIVEGQDQIGGYWVHASKIKRLGVPIETRHTLVRAEGEEQVEIGVVSRIDEDWQIVPGTEKTYEVDTICLSVGLSPLIEILDQAGCAMTYTPELGGYVPRRNEFLETSVEGFYVAGDAAGVEEATSAILEGQLAGCAAARASGHEVGEEEMETICMNLRQLRAGPVGEHVRQGLEKVWRC